MTMRAIASRGLFAALCLSLTTSALAADASSGRKLQQKGQQEIPVCTKKLGTIMIVEPETKWWTQVGLGSPEAIIKLFVTKSGCFGLVDRNRGLASRAVERALADSGELQQGSNIGKGQVKAADYALVPDIVTGNNNSGGTNVGGMIGGLLGRGSPIGALVGGLSLKKKEANVTLAVVNVRTTEQEALTEGYARKTDVGFGGGAGGWFGGGLAAAGASGYQNTDLGQVVVLAYLDAYTKLVTQLGGLPENASAAAPVASR